MALLWLVGAWLGGIAIAGTFARPDSANGWLIVAGVGLLGILMARGRREWRLLFACLMVFALGGWRYLTVQAIQTTPTPADLSYYNNRGVVEIVGMVDDYPDIRDTSIYLRVSAQTVQDSAGQRPVSGVALVQAERGSTFRYGDQLRIRAEPSTPAQFDTFSYRDYLARTGIYSVIYRPRLELIAREQGNPILALASKLREHLYNLFDQWTPAPQSALLNGIILGLDNDLPPDVKQAFQDTGTSHIIAISGSNISVVLAILLTLTAKMRSKWLATVIVIGGIFGYAFFVGASASVIRAAGAGALTVLALRVGRQSWGLNSLALTVFVQTAVNPLLIADGGLLLSALATLGILLYVRPLSAFADRLTERLIPHEAVRGMVSVVLAAILTTIAAQITVLPIQVFIFGRVSLVTLLANALIVPAQGPIMALGVLAAALGLILPPLGLIVSWIAMIPISYTLWIVRTVAGWPGIAASVQIEPGAVLAYYAILFGLTIYASRPAEKRHWGKLVRGLVGFPVVGGVGVAVAVLVWGVALGRPDGRLHVAYLDVGEGTAVLIRTPNGATILIDGGQNPSRLRGALGDRLPFFQRELDLYIQTDSDKANVAALPALQNRYSVRYAVAPAATNIAGQWVAARDHQTLRFDDGVSLEIWQVAADLPWIVTVRYGEAIFTTISSRELLKPLSALPTDLTATVLHLPARGTVDSTWLRDNAPQIIVRQSDTGASLSTLSGQTVYDTGKRGAIDLSTDGQTLDIRTGR